MNKNPFYLLILFLYCFGDDRCDIMSINSFLRRNTQEYSWEATMKKGLKIGLIVGGSVIGAAIITLVTIALIMTSSFKDSIKTFESDVRSISALKAYESEFISLRDEATDASDSFRFWSYGDYRDSFDAFIEKAKGAGSSTDVYLEKLAKLKDAFGKLYSLGGFKAEVESKLKDADRYGSEYNVAMYDNTISALEKLLSTVGALNKKMASYVVSFKEARDKYETTSHLDGDLAADYEDAKQAALEAIESFNESSASISVPAYCSLVDTIIANTQTIISRYNSDIDDFVSHASNNGYIGFELYKVNDLASKYRKAAKKDNYEAMEQYHTELADLINETDAVISYDNFLSWVQADVSDDDSVKLYMSSSAPDSYNLKLEDFAVYEENNGEWDERKATDLSQIRGMMSIDLVADISGSMSWDFYPMQCAVEEFINSTSPDTTLGLSTIGTIYERYQHMTKDKQAIRNSLWSLECYGLTSLYQSLYSSVVYTASQTGSRCVVAFTDGINEPYGTGYDYSAQDVIDVSKYYQVPVYIIGIGSSVDSKSLKEIANKTGGQYFENISVSNLSNVYSQIYEKLGKLYALTYNTGLSNDRSRTIYVRYCDDYNNYYSRIDGDLDASTLQTAYKNAGLDGNDLVSYYRESSYLSSDDLAKLGDSLEKLQTIINIYFAHYGYKFSTQSALDKMHELGVLSGNGTLSNDETLKKMKKDTIVYQNLSALFNRRYELIFKAASSIYYSNPYISYDDLKEAVHDYYNESNKSRFSHDVSAAWKALRS